MNAIASAAVETQGRREFPFTERDFRRVCSLIHQRAGIALSASKRDMVYSRLARRLRAVGLATFADYLDFLESGTGAAADEEWQAFTNALTTNLTAFFRESHHFDALAKHLQAHRGRRPLRIWCNAASTGEEPWSLAITACEAFGTLRPDVEIIATDIDTLVLGTARRAVYSLERIEGLSPERKRRFFQRGTGPHEGSCRVREELQSLVSFHPLNLLAPAYGLSGQFDAIFCRNVMIYFDKPTQRQVIERMVPLLAPDGLFFAGHSESFLHAADLIQSIGRTIYRAAGRPA